MNLFPILRANLIRHEGWRNQAYRDSEGYWTIGVGHKISNDKSLDASKAEYTDDEIELQLKWDIEESVMGAYNLYDDFNSLPVGIKLVLIEMVFNMGLKTVKKFKETLKALHQHHWERMAHEMLDSKWARQVGNRAEYLASIVEGHAE